MADHASVIHATVSAIADLPGSAIKPSDWNHGHTFQGGVDNDVLTKDSTQTDGVLFKSVLSHISGRLVTFINNFNSLGSSGSPTVDFGNLSFTLKQSNSNVLVIMQTNAVDSNSTAHAITVTGLMDNVTFTTYNIDSLGTFTSIINPFLNLTAGVHEVKGHFTTPNAPFVSVTLAFMVLEFTDF
jgi:hypothetical protein